MPANKALIGLDLGGSAVKAGLVTYEGKVKEFKRYDLPPEKTVQQVIDIIKKAVEDLSTKASEDNQEIGAIGIGAAGIINMDKGIIVSSPNFHGWKDVPIKELLEKSLGIPIHLDNDANAAAYGEKWAGAGKNARSLVCITLGTGVGGGLILNGEVWHGDYGMGGEVGHITVDPDGPPCACGNRGCLEAFSSATGIVRRAKELVKFGKGNILARIARGNPEVITGKMVYEGALKGDEAALIALREAGKYLGIGMASLINLLNPSMIVLTGEVTGSWDFFMPAAMEEVRSRAFQAMVEQVKIEKGKLPEKAGVIGAAGLALKHF